MKHFSEFAFCAAQRALAKSTSLEYLTSSSTSWTKSGNTDEFMSEAVKSLLLLTPSVSYSKITRAAGSSY